MKHSKWHERSKPIEISENYEIAMKIACYCWVSTRQQKNDSQKSEIRKWLEGNGIDPAQVDWYFDHESGKTLCRPEFR
jgi:DNA invertase Pin-like site-specific DNA recombinase